MIKAIFDGEWSWIWGMVLVAVSGMAFATCNQAIDAYVELHASDCSGIGDDVNPDAQQPEASDD